MIYAMTHCGKSHEVSEDSVVVGKHVITDDCAEFDIPETGFVCIADGVGGNNGGAQASSFICEMLANEDSCCEETLKSKLIAVNDALITLASNTDSLKMMASTLSGVFIKNNNYYLIHVGNTRAYLKQGRYLKQITTDHTTYNWLMSSMQYSAAQNCNKNEISNCFGGANAALLDRLYILALPEFSVMLLTSDGVHDYVQIDTLEEILDNNCLPHEKCRKIIQQALNEGSSDDMSVVLIYRK